MTTTNPWLGLASYEEQDEYRFCGRDKETLDVVRLIDNNLFITLYGRSGIGKTSLLRAGVIPILRRKDYFPLYVRLSQEPKDISYASTIVLKLKESGLTIKCGAEMKHPAPDKPLFLWEYFATTRFFIEELEVYPVIILDQFEEVFRDADKDKAKLLLQQIYLLLNDELEMPDEEGWRADTNYRFMASIREDFLFMLEDSIDELSLDLYKNNRYRLHSIKWEQARQVVLGPGKDCIDAEDKAVVASRVVSMAERGSNNSIDTLLLSLICSEMYNAANQKRTLITKELIEQLGDNILASFYKNAMNLVSPRTAIYLESHLLTQNGFRNSMALEDILHDNIKEVDLNNLIDKKLICINYAYGIKRVEFTHDALCAMAKSSRDKGLYRKKETTILTGYIFDFIIPFIAVSISLILSLSGYSLKFVTDETNLGFKYYLPIFAFSFVLFASSIIIIPYRHTKERNTTWLLLILQLQITLYLIWSLYHSDFHPSTPVDWFNLVIWLGVIVIWLGVLIYTTIHFFISFSFKKTRSFKKAFQYALKFKSYKEHPQLKKIIPSIPILAVILAVLHIIIMQILTLIIVIIT